MRWKKYSVDMEMTGITRKTVSEILAEEFKSLSEFCLEDNGYHVQDQNNRFCPPP